MREPPFCPNAHCQCHFYPGESEHDRWYSDDGVFVSNREGLTQRYRCRECGKRFSEATFSLDYYAKRKINLYRLRRHLVSGSSIRATSRQLFCAPGTVTRRLMILARQSIAAHAALSPHHARCEPLVADGFESFWVSQYHPNNFNLLCGSDSQYVHALTTVSLKRSGRMREAQRKKRERIEALDPSDPAALEHSFGELVSAATRLWHRQREEEVCTGDERCILITDEHQSYPKAILPFRALTHIVHWTVSSQLARTGDNPLFAVNYIDREIRKDLAEHHRETMCFARSASHSVARMWVYLVWHNIEKPYRISPRSPLTHAEVSGVPRDELRRQKRKLMRRRAFLCHSHLSESQRRDWLQLHWTPERENRTNRRVTPRFAAV